VKVVGVFRHGEKILVSNGPGVVSGRPFCTLPGGGIEFGETADAAIRRELQEELNCTVDQARCIGVFESIHKWNTVPEHEIVFVYLVTTSDNKIFSSPSVHLNEEPEWNRDATWRTLDEIAAAGLMLYPFGVSTLLLREISFSQAQGSFMHACFDESSSQRS
jgi:ADP-ribose pyrophosphatase YjhB (NUDIX family)